MAVVRSAKFKLLYNGVDITEDITRYGTSVSYTDNDEGESDQIEVVLEDVDNLWKNSWYPEKGAKLTLSIGYDSDDRLVDYGDFEIDEITVNGPPDTVTIKALAAVIKSSLRTKRSKSFENVTLREIAAYIATKNKLALQGVIPSVRFDRVTQYREKDLSFLRRVSIEYGCLFSVRGSKLIFTQSKDLEAAEAVATIDRSELKTFTLKDKTGETYKNARSTYRNPGTGNVHTATVEKIENRDGYTYSQISTDDTLEIRSKAETTEQAEKKAEAGLHHKNSQQTEGTLVMEGNRVFVAGNNINLTGLGILSGKYYIKKSSHKINKSGGYETTIEIKRTVASTSAARTSTPSTAGKKPNYVVTPFTNADGINFVQINNLPR
jgi:phage protein D